MSTRTHSAEVEMTPGGLAVPNVDVVEQDDAPATGRRARTNPLRGLLSNRKAVIGASILTVFILMAVLAPWITRYEPDDFVASPIRRRPPSTGSAPMALVWTSSPKPCTERGYRSEPV